MAARPGTRQRRNGPGTLPQKLAPLPQRSESNLPTQTAQLPVRLLATAYDDKWRLKPIADLRAFTPRKDGSWFSTEDRRPFTCPSRPRSGRLRSAGSVRSSGPGRPMTGSLSLPATLESRPNTSSVNSLRAASGTLGGTSKVTISPPGSPKSRTSPRSPPGSPKRLKKKSTHSLSLPNLPLPADGGLDSARSDKEQAEMNQNILDLQRQESEGDQRELKSLGDLAMFLGVPLDIATQALDTFLEFVSNPPPRKYAIEKKAILYGKKFDAGVDLGSMNTESFGKACLQIADCKDFSMLPPGFLENAMSAADKDGSGDIDFGEFLYFFYKFSFSEEVLIGPAERQMRLAARQLSIPYDFMSKYKRLFDQTDINHNGLIDYEEFSRLVVKLLKAGHEGLPERRTKEMFKEACRGLRGEDHSHLDFITFVGWYKRYFGDDHLDSGESPFEAYYHNIRRVSVWHPHEED